MTMKRHVYPSHEEMLLRLLAHYEDAEGSTLDDGAEWYALARREARRLSRAYDVTLRQAAGIIAALSPQVQWRVNLRLAEQVCRDGDVDGACLKASADKAWRIRNGEAPLAVLGGPKVRAFYRALMGDPEAAVLDTWMFQALDWPDGGTRSGRQYERAEGALREAARLVSLPVSELQAIVWCHVRGAAH